MKWQPYMIYGTDNMKQKVVVGLSGGVDSSVAAYTLLSQGYDVIGVTMHVFGDVKESRAVADAEKVAECLNIPHYVLDFTKEFKENVVDYFIGEYMAGRTPNPCVMCNHYVKWEALLLRAKEFGAEYVATGHYARIKQLDNGRYVVMNSATAEKDQTYALNQLTQEQLAHTLMPVGEYTKTKIRQIAKEAGIPVADKKDSQDICFIPDGDYHAFLEKYAPCELSKEGNFVNTEGKILGRHKGIVHYTIGQRKGLGIALGKPVFVSEIRPDLNEVVISDTGDVFSKELCCNHLNFMAVEDLKEKEEVLAKVRYAHKGTPAIIEKISEDMVKCTFKEDVRAVTPGQSVVFYQNDYVFGSGIITENAEQ